MQSSGFCCSGKPQSENKRKRKDRQIQGPCLRTKNKTLRDIRVTKMTTRRCTWNVLQRLGKRTEKTGNQRKNRDLPNYCIIEKDQNTETSPGDVLSLKTPVKD